MCRIWKQEEWIMAELNIAIAEDNTLMLELLGNILEEEDGFHVVGKADNGEDRPEIYISGRFFCRKK